VNVENTIWQTDRWFTFPKFEETAKKVAAIMRGSKMALAKAGALGLVSDATENRPWPRFPFRPAA
jgi:hypothetical protein